MPENDSSSHREPVIDWNAPDQIPVLTDIVDADEIAAPATQPAGGDEPGDWPAVHVNADDLDPPGMETADEALDLTPLWNADAVPPKPRESRLDEMRAALTAELEVAATRIVAEAVSEVEALLVERVSQRLKDELAGIVGATLNEFERRGKPY